MDQRRRQPAGEAVARSPMQRQVHAQVHHRSSTVHMTSAMALPHKQHQGRHLSQQKDSWDVVQACTRQYKQGEIHPIAVGVFHQP